MNRTRLPNLRSRGSRRVRTGSATQGFSKIKLALVVMLILLVLMSSLAIAIQYKGRVWKSGSRVSFVVQVDAENPNSRILLVNILSNKGVMQVISYPPEIKIETVGGYGLWRLNSLYLLGEIEGKSESILTQSISEFMGADVTGYLVDTGGGVEFSQGELRDNLKLLILDAVRGGFDTNFSWYDLARLYKLINSIPKGDISFIKLEEAGVLDEKIQPDGEMVFTADSEFLDRMSEGMFSYTEVVDEEIPIAIVNATEHRGLGADAGRMIRNIGGDLTTISDFEENLEQTKFVVSDRTLEGSFTLVKLKEIFFPREIEIGPTDEYRSEILIVLGEDYWQRLD